MFCWLVLLGIKLPFIGTGREVILGGLVGSIPTGGGSSEAAAESLKSELEINCSLFPPSGGGTRHEISEVVPDRLLGGVAARGAAPDARPDMTQDAGTAARPGYTAAPLAICS